MTPLGRVMSRSKIPGQRWVWVFMSLEIAEGIHPDRSVPIEQVEIPGFPPGHRILGTEIREAEREVCCIVEHESFPDCANGKPPTILRYEFPGSIARVSDRQ